MEHTNIISPSELEDFSNRRDSEPIIPELIALLINLSVPDLLYCRIPYGDSIGLPGLDGIVKTEGGYRQFVPKQTSYWEIGRGKDAQNKATNDYRKRTKSTPKIERKNASFVFVTSRSKEWEQSSQNKWIKRRQNDGWKEIKIIDGVQLCDWLREFPVVGKWLLQRIGLTKNLSGFNTPAEHWQNLTQLFNKDDPPLPPELFLSGRELAYRQLERLFRNEIHQLVFSIESENDAEDFIAAFLESLDENTRRTFSNKCLFISNAEAWYTFSNLRISHILVASPRIDLAETNEQLHLEAGKNNHNIVFSVSGAWAHGAGTIIPIMSPSRESLEQLLLKNGLKKDRATELASAGANSLSALKRYLRGLGDLPPYASWDNARILAQASLIGKWKGDNDADKNAIEILLGKSYGEWIEAARAETLRAASPLIQKNETWKIITRGEAWSALGPRINDKDLDCFQTLALRILGEIDPQFDLPKDERYSAAIYGKVLAHSNSIREGVLESVALLGVKGSALSSTSIGKTERIAESIVRKLLHNAGWQTWASLNYQMPLLAEAAPNEFLDAVEAALIDPKKSPFVEIFQQEASGFSGRNYISGILWALETLAWNQDYLGRVTILLGDLASIDPGGNWANRPRNSLTDIFLPWRAHTVADLPTRRSAIKSLLQEHPEVAWNLLLNLIPNTYGVTSGTHKPIWRSFIPRGWSEKVPTLQYHEQIQMYAEFCTNIAANNKEKLSQLVERIADLPEPAHSQVLSHLSSSVVTSLPETERLSLWEALMDIILKHRKFSDAQWAMSEHRIKKIEKAVEKLAPESFELVNRRFFTERETVFYEDKADYEKEKQRLDNIRQEVLLNILNNNGMEGIVRFAQMVESSRKVGETLGAINDDQIDFFLLPAFLNHKNNTLRQFLSGYVWRKFWIKKMEWVNYISGQSWSKKQFLEFFLLLPSEKQIWDRVEKILGIELKNYWKRVRFHPWGLESEELLEAAEKLTLNGQSAYAINCLYMLSRKKVIIPIKLASKTLLSALGAEDQQKLIDHHHTIKVISWLQENSSLDSQELFKIEWNYLPLLNRLDGGEPKVLEYKLASSPDFYCNVIALVFRSDKEDSKKEIEINEKQIQIAKNAYSLIHGWRILPGYTPDKSFDGNKFTEWLDEVKKLSNESGHFQIAMDQLGQALAYAPEDPGGLWLHKSIATALNSRELSTLRKAYITGLYNKRGVHGFTFGEEEKQIAADYRMKAKILAENGFHRVADAIRDLAKGYEREAERDFERDNFE